MGTNKIKTVDMSIQPEDKKAKKTKADNQPTEKSTTDEKTVIRQARSRSKRYIMKKGHVDRTKTYLVTEAVELVKKTSYSRFAGTVSADIVTRDESLQVDLTFPHSTGKTKKVAIVNDALLAEIEAGNIDFDILVTEPAFMPKLAKFARTLGPKGLMPNPKNGTVTSDPAKKVKELEGGKQTVKTEKKAPLIHLVIGKTDMTDTQLAENVEALIKAVNPRKISKLVLSATMSPGIKVDVAPYITV